jgi:hypothetical protein
MKNRILSLFVCFVFVTSAFAQSPVKETKAGHCFKINLPEYMNKTAGLNSAAAVQFKSVVKDVYGFVIYDTKEELTFLEMQYASPKDFYEDFIKDFLKDEDKRKVSDVKYTTKGEIKYAESDASYYDKDAQAEIYYLIGVVETKTAYYKVLSWCTLENKDKFKADFQAIMYSLRD